MKYNTTTVYDNHPRYNIRICDNNLSITYIHDKYTEDLIVIQTPFIDSLGTALSKLADNTEILFMNVRAKDSG